MMKYLCIEGLYKIDWVNNMRVLMLCQLTIQTKLQENHEIQVESPRHKATPLVHISRAVNVFRLISTCFQLNIKLKTEWQRKKKVLDEQKLQSDAF